ncbi:MAG: hypothetical protein B7Z59_10245 [Acidiphilium sp. 37-67-22]|nr:MAG: hypothetical protein B7Z59_10245 [Acidiphilium sp. 37-67-22]
MMKTQAEIADLSAYPDLVVVLLGMRVKTLAGLRTLFGVGRPLGAMARQAPEGLLHHETFLWRINHVGIRQYCSAPHKDWWRAFSADTGGTAIWHEAYQRGGGMEGIYLDLDRKTGFGTFAPLRPRDRDTASSRQRLAGRP